MTRVFVAEKSLQYGKKIIWISCLQIVSPRGFAHFLKQVDRHFVVQRLLCNVVVFMFLTNEMRYTTGFPSPLMLLLFPLQGKTQLG